MRSRHIQTRTETVTRNITLAAIIATTSIVLRYSGHNYVQTISRVSLNGRANYGENYFSLATFYLTKKDENGEIENEDRAEQKEEEKARRHTETSWKELDDSNTSRDGRK